MENIKFFLAQYFKCKIQVYGKTKRHTNRSENMLNNFNKVTCTLENEMSKKYKE